MQTITTAQIRALRNEAAAAGDSATVEICNVALSSDEHGDGECDHAAYGVSTRSEAIARCAQWIADAAAMAD